MNAPRCRGAIFDLDGVITRTASVHFKAWKATFDDFLKKHGGASDSQPFTEEDYRLYVDGKPRYEGVRSFLASRSVDIPLGSSGDTAGNKTIYGIGKRKNHLFQRIVEQEGVEVFSSSVALVRDFKARGLKVGIASSSRNCRLILEKAGLYDLFETVIGGRVSKEMGLKGKPAPDIFLTAAGKLKLSPADCLMVEDAISGVQAGTRGGFGLVIGVARGDDLESLLAHGADIAVKDLAEITWERITSWFETGLAEDAWQLRYQGFDPGAERLRETLTTVGNGYFGSRACLETEKADDEVHYPGTYLAGLYNTLTTEVHGRMIPNNDFVNCPNGWLLELDPGGGEFTSPLKMKISGYQHHLHYRHALMTREMILEDLQGRRLRLLSRRFASMDQRHLAVLEWEITPLNFSGEIRIRSALDGSVINGGVPRYRALNSRHLAPVAAGERDGLLTLEMQTVTSEVRLFWACRTRIHFAGKEAPYDRTLEKKADWIANTFTLKVSENQSVRVEKVVSLITSREAPLTELEGRTLHMLDAAGDFEVLYQAHRVPWESFWERADILIEGDRYSQKVTRLHLYHLFVTASRHNTALDAGMPARGLHGEAYRGHIFWDELFIFPFFNRHFPEITRSLLLYRYRRLDGARAYAHEHGYPGAMYPWQTADGSGEETQELHYNPLSGNWGPDLSRRQRHVSLAIAWNVWEYVQSSRDLDFLHRYGAEMMLEIMRFWAGIARWDEKDQRYHISGVMGPDEFHEKYPDATEPGIEDNTYTNLMVVYLMHRTLEMLKDLPQNVRATLENRLGFNAKDADRFKEVAGQMYIPLTTEGLLEQFKGYLLLQELNFEAYREKYGDIHRMDRILKSEGDSPDHYQVAKQADCLMLFYLLSPAEVAALLEQLGHRVQDALELFQKNYDYYIHRTCHGSTLSLVVHAEVLKYLHVHRKSMWTWFERALRSDIEDTQGGTTQEGIHCGVMAGTLDIIIRSFAGIRFTGDALHFDPCLPPHWRRLEFSHGFRENRFQVLLQAKEIRLTHLSGPGTEFPVHLRDRRYTLKSGKPLVMKY